MHRPLIPLFLVLMLCSCGGKALPLPPGWPLPQLTLPPDAHALPLAQLAPTAQPYYVTGNDDSYQPAKEALGRLLDSVRAPDSGVAADAYNFSGQPIRSMDGSLGTGWGVAMTSNDGFDTALANCELALKPLGYEIVIYRQGRLRTYYSRDRRTEVTLVAGQRNQLLLVIAKYDPPLPSERQLAERDDLQRAAKAIGEQVRSRALEIASGKSNP